MRNIQLPILMLILTVALSAQTLRIQLTDSTASGKPDSSYVFKGYVHNDGATAEVIKLKRTLNNIPEGWTTTLCFGESCYPAWVDEPDPVGVNPGDSIFFDIAFNTDENPGAGQARLLFEAMVSGEKDSILFSVKTETPPPLKISPEKTTDHGKPGESFVFKGYVHNNSQNAMVVQLTRVKNLIPQDWTTTLCFGSNCYPSFVDQPDPVAINPGDSAFFDIAFNTSARPDTGKALLRFEDVVSGYKDSIWISASTLLPPAIKLGHTIHQMSGVAGDSFELGGYVFNLTDSLLTVNLIRVLNNLPQDWSSSICFDVCVSPTVDSVQSLIAPHDSLAYTLTVYSAGAVSDSGKIRLKFFAQGAYDTLYQDFAVSVTATAIGDAPNIAARGFRLFGNYPNPFNPQTTIRYQLEKPSRVKIDLFTIDGKFVRTLLHGLQNSGYHELRVTSDHLASGVYYYRLRTETHTAFGKMVLLK